MKPPIQLPPIESPARRKWVLALDPERIHQSVRVRLFMLDIEVTGAALGIRPQEELTSLGDLLLRATTTPRQGPPMPGTRLDELIHAVKSAYGSAEAFSIQQLGHILERVTIDLLHFTINRAALRTRADSLSEVAALVEKTLSPLHDWHAKWAEWCISPAPRNLDVLTEYEDVYAALSELEPTAGTISRILQRRVSGRSGNVRLGNWSVTLRPGWQTRSSPEWAPSEWAGFLLGEKHATNTRVIKKQLADQRLERKINAAWSSYGSWLTLNRDALHEFEVLFGTFINPLVPGIASK